MTIARTNIEIPWTWEHRIDDLRLGEIDLIVSVDCKSSYPVDPDDIGWSIDCLFIETSVRVIDPITGARWTKQRHALPWSDNLVAVMISDLHQDPDFAERVRELAIEQAQEAV